MDACLPPTSMSMHHHRSCPVSTNSAAASPPYFISFTGFTGRSTLHFRSNFNRIRASVSRSYYYPFPSFPGNPRAWSTRCHARSPGPPPPPKLEPPSGESSSSSSGALSTFSQVQDAVRIFFAVLFWMSLFFWSCIWDGNSSGRQGKGPRFRR